MYINDNVQAIYIHLVKNGGNYVREILEKQYSYRHWGKKDHPCHDDFSDPTKKDLDRYVHSITKKGKVRYYEANTNIHADKLRTYFTFTFVRNPYERVVSAFAYLKRTLYDHKKKTGSFVLHKTPESIEYYDDFATFVRHRDDVVPVAYYHAFGTQYDQLVNEAGEINISYIGRVETLNDDLIACMTKLGKELRHVDEIFYGKRKNTTDWGDKDMVDCYDKTSFEFVNTHFAQDFERFGYRKYASWEEFVDQYPRTLTNLSTKPSEKRITDLFVPQPIYVPARETTSKTHRIPLNIIQTFKTNVLHPVIYNNIQQILKLNPDCNYYLITDEIGEALIQAHFDDRVMKAYKKLQNGSAKGDFLRYVALYVYGGIYLDMDAGIMTQLSTFIPENIDFILRYYEDLVMVSQWIVMIQEKHGLLQEIIEEMVHRIEQEQSTSVILVTGPKLFSDVVYKFLNQENVYHVQEKLSLEERLRTIVHHPCLTQLNGLILPDLQYQHLFRFQFLGYRNHMLYYDAYKYNEPGGDGIYRNPKKHSSSVLLHHQPSMEQKETTTNLYKELLLFQYGQSRQQQSIQVYNRIIEVLFSELKKQSTYQEEQSIRALEIELNDAKDAMITTTRVMEQRIQDWIQPLYRQYAETITSHVCPTCSWVSWNQLAHECHSCTCLKGTYVSLREPL